MSRSRARRLSGARGGAAHRYPDSFQAVQPTDEIASGSPAAGCGGVRWWPASRRRRTCGSRLRERRRRRASGNSPAIVTGAAGDHQLLPELLLQRDPAQVLSQGQLQLVRRAEAAQARGPAERQRRERGGPADRGPPLELGHQRRCRTTATRPTPTSSASGPVVSGGRSCSGDAMCARRSKSLQSRLRMLKF